MNALKSLLEATTAYPRPDDQEERKALLVLVAPQLRDIAQYLASLPQEDLDQAVGLMHEAWCQPGSPYATGGGVDPVARQALVEAIYQIDSGTPQLVQAIDQAWDAIGTKTAVGPARPRMR